MTETLQRQIEERDDLIAWILRECDCVHGRTGELIRNRDQAEKIMAEDQRELSEERAREGRAA
jgi:hypothetical protein